MNFKFGKVLLASALVVGLSSASMAGMKGSNEATEKKGKSETSMAVSQLLLAGQLVDYGMAKRDPIPLITAAKITKGIEIEESNHKAETTQDGAAGTAKKTAGPAKPKTSDEILAIAREYAGGKAEVLAMITDVEEEDSRGRTRGPGRICTKVNSRSSDTYKIKFRGEEQAIIGVRGDGDTDLDLFVYDENNNRICSDTDGTDRMVCAWTPAWTGKFKVKVKNLGSVFNRYCLLTN